MDNIQAFDVLKRPLPLRFCVNRTECGGMSRISCTMHNDGPETVTPALVRLFRLNTGSQELHLFKPGMQKPSDTARFYTIHTGEKVPYVNTWRGEWLTSFGPHELLISSMSCMQMHDCWLGVGFDTFESFHGLIVFRTDTPEIEVEAWLETEEILLEPGESVELESFVQWEMPDFNDAYSRYIRHLTDLHGMAPHPEQRGSAGWSDWEFYRNDKTSRHIIESAEALAEANRAGLPIQSVVVDGGWAENLAEWTVSASSIPEGAERLLRNIRAKGLHSGIWFAPWIVNTACKLVQEHPEWLLHDKDGHILGSTISNVGAKRTLDFSVAGTMEHLDTLLKMFCSWGISHLKLDGPVLAHYDKGRFHNPRSTRFRQIRAVLKRIREVCPDMIIESEGVYGPAVGIADCHRVTQDEHPFWTDPHWGISVTKINSLVMLLSAAWDKECWSNINLLALRDFATPNLYYLSDAVPDSPEGEFLEPLPTENELQVMMSAIALSGSTVYFSAPQELAAKSPETMKRQARLLPVLPDGKLQVLDPEKDWPSLFHFCGPREITAVFNWGETFADHTVTVPEDTVFYDFFREKVLYNTNGELCLKNMPPRSCRLLWHCPTGKTPTLAGASNHILGQGAVCTDEARQTVLDLDIRDTSDQSATLLLPEPFAEIRAVLTPYRGGPEREIPILADYRAPGELCLHFTAPETGKLRITLMKNK